MNLKAKADWKDIIIWILFIIALSITAGNLFGNSPTLEEALLVLILTILYATNTKISDIDSRLGTIERRFNNMEKSFIKLVNDFKTRRN